MLKQIKPCQMVLKDIQTSLLALIKTVEIIYKGQRAKIIQKMKKGHTTKNVIRLNWNYELHNFIANLSEQIY